MANIQKRGDNSWYFTVIAGKDSKGKYIRRTRTIKVEDPALLKTTKRLQDYINDEYSKFRQEVEAGEYIAPEKMTFAAFVEEWKAKYGVKHLQPATLEGYMSHLKNRIIPVFGQFRLDSIKTIQIVNFVDGLQREQRQDGSTAVISSATVQYIHRVIKNVFSRAVDWKVIKSNPVAGVKKPKAVHKQMEVYNNEEVEQLFNALAKETQHWRMFVTLALITGLRRGELLGLEWKHVDTDKGTIDVCQALTFSHDQRYTVKEPKTANSKRIVTLPTPIIPELKAFKKECNKDRMKTEELWEGGAHFFVFTAWNGKPLNPSSVTLWWGRFMKRAKLKHIRFHDLRHTSATLLLNQGVHAKIISSRLGHSNISTTMNIYAHALREADQAAADTFNSLFTPKVEKKIN
jgi:integrase